MAKQQPGQSKKFNFPLEGKRIDDLENQEIPVPRLWEFYKETVIPNLMKEFNFSSVMQVPKLQKICLNMGVGRSVQDPKALQSAINELELISGQRPVIRKAKKAISNFKLRENVPIGTSVTLRRTTMYEFLDRFINISAPRIRDFRGFPDKSFDGKGNYTLGIKEQIIFPEIDVDKVNNIGGLDITFVIKAASDEEGRALMNQFGFPFRRKN
ncbi:50S ribosomal protein L5 [Candidatus Kapabacteria bacterium]|nr:50S ribosomal protein L5 [Candidatus Kapabacteria bacterium]